MNTSNQDAEGKILEEEFSRMSLHTPDEGNERPTSNAQPSTPSEGHESNPSALPKGNETPTPTAQASSRQSTPDQSPPTSDITATPEECRHQRYKLVKPFLKQDALLLQQINITTELNKCEELKEDYTKTHMAGGGEGVVLNREKFTDITRYKGSELFLPHFNRANDSIRGRTDKVLRAKDFYFLKATPRDPEEESKGPRYGSILFVSYHGPAQCSNYRVLYSELIKMCESIKEDIAAKYLIIGGDFNYHAWNFEINVKLGRIPNTCRLHYDDDYVSEHRADRDVIDYFILSPNIKCESIKTKDLPTDVEGINYDRLDFYLDHDPIVATFTINPDQKEEMKKDDEEEDDEEDGEDEDEEQSTLGKSEDQGAKP